MKVLYALWNYPQLSETYIAAEIAFALKSGVHVEVWSPLCRHPEMISPCKVHRGTLEAAIAAVKPNVVHIHYLVYTLQVLKQIPAAMPITVRGHSFDWSVDGFNRVAEIQNVKKIFLFPHFAEQVHGHKKAVAMPVAYNSSIHKPAVDKDTKHVVRLAAGLPTKGLIKFFKVARACPDHLFTLVVSTAGGAEEFTQWIKEQKGDLLNVDVLSDISEAQAIKLNAEAGIYLDTYDPKGHSFGMPISIAEAMATGSLVLVEDHHDARMYVGNGGLMYKDADDAARMINESTSYVSSVWTGVAAAAMDRASQFKDAAVLPVLMDQWRLLC